MKKRCLNRRQRLVAWLSYRRWLLLASLAVVSFPGSDAWPEPEKLVNTRKTEKTRDSPS